MASVAISPYRTHPAPGSTHNDTLSQIITEIKNRSASSIILAERSYQNFATVLEQKGINEMAADLGFTIKSLEADTKQQYNSSSLAHWANGFEFPDTIRNAEYLVSTCCLKTTV